MYMELKDNNDIEVKKGRLDGEADIYDKNRTDITGRERWNLMTKIEKFLYYKDYYLKYTLIIAAFLIVAVYVGYTIFKPDPPDTFFLSMLDGLQYEDSIIDEVPETFGDYLRESDYNGETDQKHLFFETFYDTIVDQIRIDGFYDKSKFDVFITKNGTYEGFAGNNILMNLETVLPKELLESLSDRLIYTQGKNDSKPYPYGIKIEQAKYKFYNHKGTEEPAILSIAHNTRRPEAAVYFIRFLYGL